MLEHLLQHFDGVIPTHCFFGVVEDVNDPLMIGRVRVRCFGYHAESRVLVPTSHLPWALVLMPATSASSGGVGQTMGLQPGSWVFGFFLDGKKAQMPFVLGSIHHQHKPNPPGYGSSPSPSTGFNTMTNPPQFRGQPSGSDDVPFARQEPSTFPGPSGSITQQIPPNAYQFSNAPARDTSAIKEDSGWLTSKDTANWPSKYYTPQELASKGNGDIRFHRGTLLALDLATEKFGRKLTLNSAYRDPAHNRRVGGASKSQHMYGRAVDINVRGLSQEEKARLVAALVTSGFTGFGASETTLHADTRRVGAVWGYGPGGRSNRQPAQYLYEGFKMAGIQTTQGRPPFKDVQGSLSPMGTGPVPGSPDLVGGTSSFDSFGNQILGGGSGGTVDRSRFNAEFQSNPELYSRIAALAQVEVGGQPAAHQAFVETVFNRAEAQGSSLMSVVTNGRGRYYPNLGNPAALTPEQHAYWKGVIDSVRAGSNVSNFATDNASAGVAANRRAQGLPGQTLDGEFIYNDRPYLNWANQKRAQLAQQSTAQTYSTADIVGFNDPNQENPNPNYAGESSINKQARGLNIEDGKPAIWDEHLAQRQDGNFNSIPTASGIAWGEAETKYDASYPDNHVWSTAKHMISMDDTPSREGIIVSHMSGTNFEMHPDGSQTNKVMGDTYDINNKNSFFYTYGEFYQSIGGNEQKLAAGDKIEEVQGTREERKLNDEKMETGGSILLAAGENIRVNGVNLYFDGQAIHIHAAGPLQIRSGGDMDIVSGGKIRMKAAGNIDIKSGAEMRMESASHLNLKTGGDLKEEASGSAHYKSGGSMHVQGGSYHNASGDSQFNTIRWNAAPAPPPTGGSSNPSAPSGATAAEDALEADESDNPATVVRGASQVSLVKPAPVGPSAMDFELDAFGPPHSYIHAINRSGSPSGPGVDTSDIQWMVGDDNHHEPQCMFLGTFAKQALPNLVEEKSLHNVQGVMNFLKYTRRDGIPIPELTPEKLTELIKVAQRHRFPLDLLIGITSFKNWQGADQVATIGRMAYRAIQQANGGRDPSRGELYMAYEHGIAGAIHLIKKALDPKEMNKYVVEEKKKRDKKAIPTDPFVVAKKKLFWVGGEKNFKRWRTYREHYDFMAHRLNHGFGRAIIPGLFRAV